MTAATRENTGSEGRHHQCWWGLGLLLLLLGAASPSFRRDVAAEAPGVEESHSVSALLRLAREQPRGLLGPPAMSSPEDFADFRQTQAALLRSKPVLQAALKDKKVAALPLVRQEADPVAWLRSALRVDFPSRELLHVSLAGPASRDRATLVNAVVDSYFEHFILGEARARNERLGQLDKAVQRLKENLNQNKASLRKGHKSLGMHDIGPNTVRGRFLLGKLADCDRELRRVRLARGAAEVRAEGGGSRKEVAVLAAQEQMLTRDLATTLSEVDESEVFAYEDSLRADIARDEELLRRLGLQLEELRLEGNAPDRVSVIERAEAP